eukprot:4044779-Amphidinium_carterae.1
MHSFVLSMLNRSRVPAPFLCFNTPTICPGTVSSSAFHPRTRSAVSAVACERMIRWRQPMNMSVL